VEQQVVTGIAFSKTRRRFPSAGSPTSRASRPRSSVRWRTPAQRGHDRAKRLGRRRTTDLTFTVPAADYERATNVLAGAKGKIGYERLDGATDVAKVSVIGVGMRSHAGVAAKAFQGAGRASINIRAITTSEIKFSLLIDANYTELAVRTLHSLYELDR